MNPKDFETQKIPTWCKGCGDFGVLNSLKRACANLNLNPKDIVVVTGIGCSSKINSYFFSYGLHGIHGRILPVATGIKLANPNLTVIGAGGDGDGYAIGANHLVHALKRNIDITYIVMDNRVYGLTKGQFSPTSFEGFVTGTTPFGNKEIPLDPLKLALSCGGTFVARGFSGNIKQLIYLIEEGIKHKGFSLIDVLSPCVTFNRVNTYGWYRENILNLDESYNPENKLMAYKVLEMSEKIPVGLIYKEEKPSFEDLNLESEIPIVNQDIKMGEYEGLLQEYV